jgi:hypothetical protein
MRWLSAKQEPIRYLVPLLKKQSHHGSNINRMITTMDKVHIPNLTGFPAGFAQLIRNLWHRLQGRTSLHPAFEALHARHAIDALTLIGVTPFDLKTTLRAF